MAEQTKAIQQSTPQHVDVHRENENDATRQQSWTYRPNVDIIDTADEYTVVADIPGARQDAIDVTFQEDVLSIQAPVPPRGQNAVAVHRQEYGIGGFHRRFVVEAPVDADRMSADYDNGVLTVHLPKAEKAKGRRIEVKSA